MFVDPIPVYLLPVEFTFAPAKAKLANYTWKLKRRGLKKYR